MLVLAALGVFACGGRAKDQRVVITAGGGASGTGGTQPMGGAAGQGTSGAAGSAGAQAACAPSDRIQGALELITTSSVACRASDGDAKHSHLTPDARYVAFDSEAADLVPNDLNGRSDGFVFDRQTGSIELISKRYGADESATGYTLGLVPSDDARAVAFMALSYELVSPSPPDGIWIYLRNRDTQTTRYFPAAFACAYWVDMSGDARFIVADGFSNCQGNLSATDFDTAVEYDVETGTTRYLGLPDDGSDNYRPAITRDGRFVAWATRPPGTRGELTSRIQLFDRTTQTTVTLPPTSFNYESIDISDSGDVLAYVSYGYVYRYVISTDETTLVSASPTGDPGDGSSAGASLSGDGTQLVFQSLATNLVPGDTNGVSDVFLYDSTTATLERLSVAPDGSESDGDSRAPFISSDGTAVSFSSKARNLSPLATTGDYQLYVRTLPAR